MRNLQRPTISGGIKYPNPIIYSNLFYISNLFEYFKTRKNDLFFNSNTYLIEYEIGLVLSRIYNLRKLNHLPHRDKLTPFYQQSLAVAAPRGGLGGELSPPLLNQVISVNRSNPMRKIWRYGG